MVREAYSQLLAGASIRSITERMNDAGLPSTRGGLWQRTMVRAMLMNSRNAGIRSYRGEEITRGTWPPIVGEETWRAAVAILSDPGRKSNMHGTARKWLGGGYYLCGRCGTDCRVGYRENKVRLYICRASKHLTRAADPIDEVVAGVITARLRRPDVLAALLSAEPEIGGLRDEVTALRLRADQISADYGDGLIDARAHRVASERVTVRLAAAEKELAAVGRSSGFVGVLANRDPGAAWLALDVSARQAVAREIVAVTLLPVGGGRRPFDPQSIQFEWRTGE